MHVLTVEFTCVDKIVDSAHSLEYQAAPALLYVTKLELTSQNITRLTKINWKKFGEDATMLSHLERIGFSFDNEEDKDRFFESRVAEQMTRLVHSDQLWVKWMTESREQKHELVCAHPEGYCYYLPYSSEM